MILKPTPGNTFLVTALSTPMTVISIWFLLKQSIAAAVIMIIIAVALIFYGLWLSKMATLARVPTDSGIQPNQVKKLLAETQHLISQAKSQKTLLDQFQQLANHIPMPMWLADQDGKLIFVNQAWQSQHVDFEEGQPLPESEITRLETHQHALKTGNSHSLSTDLGNDGNLTITSIPFSDGTGCAGYAIKTSNNNRLTDTDTQLGNRLFARHWLDQQIISGKTPALLAIQTSKDFEITDLPSIATELSRLATNNLIPARISEHHLGLLVADVNDPREILELVKQISELLVAQPDSSESGPLFGLARHPAQGNNGADLIHHALADLNTASQVR